MMVRMPPSGGASTAAAAAASASKLLLLGSAKFRSFRCLWMLEELQIPFHHDFMARPQSKVAQQYHPLGKIPSLVVFDNIQHEYSSNRGTTHDGGSGTTAASSSSYWSLYESTAINTFLADTYGKFIPPNSSTTVSSLLQQQPQQSQSHNNQKSKGSVVDVILVVHNAHDFHRARPKLPLTLY